MSINLQEIINKLQTAKIELQQQGRFSQYAEGLDAIIKHTSEPLMLMVMGSFSTGKSSFINALVGEEIAAVEAKPTTAVVTKLCYGTQDKLLLHFRDGSVKSATPKEFNRMTAVNDEAQLNAIHEKLDYVERQMPIDILKQISIIDSPGLNDVAEKHSEATERFVNKADTVLWMFSTVQLGTREEMAAMDKLTPRLKPIAVVNKMDLIDEEEDDPQEILANAKKMLQDRVQAVVGISTKYELEGKKENNALKRELGNFAEMEKAVADLVLPHREKFKLNTLLDELGSYFDAFNKEFTKAKKENEAKKSRNYALYMQNEKIFMQLEDILNQVVEGMWDYCEREAGRNNEQALYFLGVLYDSGVGVLQNTEKALKFYQKAAMKNHQGSMLNMYHYYCKQGVSETAEYWLKNLAEQGLVEAQKKYIDILEEQKKFDEYFSWCKKVAETGDVAAEYKVAECLAQGIGCTLNEVQAINYYRKIVSRWNVDMQCALADNFYYSNGEAFHVVEIYAKGIDSSNGYKLNKVMKHTSMKHADIECQKEAFFWYSQLAATGFIAAKKQLAECLYRGKVCLQDKKSALVLYKKVYQQGFKKAKNMIDKIESELRFDDYKLKAEQGNIAAQYALAECLYKGEGCNKNKEQAVIWYKKIIDGWSAEAIYVFADNLYYGNKKICFESVVDIYKEAIDENNNYTIKKVMSKIGDICTVENGTRLAIEWYKKAAEHGLAKAQNRYAELLFEAGKYTEAFKWFEMAAKQGLAVAQTYLVDCYVYGLGVSTDYIIAKQWCAKAVKQDYDVAQYFMAKFFVRDAKERYIWYRKAADQGYAKAQNMVGRYFEEGRGNISKNEAKAVEWFRKAAEQGYDVAQNNLGINLEQGRGCVVNLKEAYEWYKKAAEQGHAGAQDNLADCLFFAKGCSENVQEALVWAKKAAMQGNAHAQNNLAYCLLNAIGCIANKEEAVEWYRKAAEQGYAAAQNALADCLDNGNGCQVNHKEAFEWYKKAAEQGLAEAEAHLVDCYVNGIGVNADNEIAKQWCAKAVEQEEPTAQYFMGKYFTKDVNERFAWYKKAAEQGHAEAQNMVGRYYEEGWGKVTKNEAEAIVWYRKSADQGEVLAQYNLAECLIYGCGCEVNKAEAYEWYKKAAEQGHAEAQNMVGRYYAEGWGNVTKNEAKAILWYRKAANQGNKYAQNNFGICLYNGRGCTANKAEAYEWYRKAAEQGHAYAQNNLGNCLYNGQGCDVNKKEAVEWYRKAAEQGNDYAQNNLGNCLYNGQGCDANKKEAVEWYRKAAEQGYAYAQENLGNCLYNGQGCDVNKKEAVEWYRKAAEQGNKDAEKAVNRIETLEKYNLTKAQAEKGSAAAQNELGECLRFGRGCNVNKAEAYKWYEKAADQGYADAEYNLAYCFENGYGCDKSEKKALKWYKKAEEHGCQKATNAINVLKRKSEPVSAEEYFRAHPVARENNDGCFLQGCFIFILQFIVFFIIIGFLFK